MTTKKGNPLQRFWPWIAALAIVGGMVLWKEVLEDRFIPKRWGVVEEGLIYRSGQLDAHLIEKVLRRHRIEQIIAMTGRDPNDPDQQAEERVAQTLGIPLRRFPLGGKGTGDPNQYVLALEALAKAKQAGHPTLVHCAAGSQRTGGVIALYRLLFEHEDPQTVYRELKRYDWHDKPDAPLVSFLNEHLPEIARKLVERGVLTDPPDPLPRLYSKYDGAGADSPNEPPGPTAE